MTDSKATGIDAEGLRLVTVRGKVKRFSSKGEMGRDEISEKLPDSRGELERGSGDKDESGDWSAGKDSAVCVTSRDQDTRVTTEIGCREDKK